MGQRTESDVLREVRLIMLSSSHNVIVCMNVESSHRDLLTKYLFERGYLPGKCVCVRSIGISWKIVCVRELDRVSWKLVGVRGLDRASWKMSICSMTK